MSKQLIIGLIFGILLTSGPVLAQKGKIRKAQNLIEALDYQAAIDILLPLSENNDNAEIATMLGHIFRKQNSYGKAAVWYEKAVALEGVEAAAYFYYGMMLLHTDKCREAQDQFDYFLSLKPLDPRQFQLRDACSHRQSLLKKDENTLEVEVLAINSVLSDIGPAFYKNGLVFGSVRSPLNGGSQDKADPFYDLYYAEMVDGHFDFTDPQSFSDRINSRVHEAIVTFNSDATKIYFTRNQGIDNEHSSATATGLEIVYAVSEDGNRWSDLQLLPFNSPKYSIAHPSLSPDGSMLFFSSDMPGGFGGKDIYVSKWEEHYWGDPVNLGPLVNTEGDEMFPFYHPSGKLFFSSDGQVGLGGQDIFSTSPNKAGVWDNIQNIGAPINTEFDDYGIIVSPDEEYGYFTSNRPGGIGKDDIYGFQKPQEEKEEELVTQQEIPEGNKVVVHVQVIDASNGKRIENPVITNCEANLYRSVGTSSFQMNLFPGDCCEVSVSAPGFQDATIEICGDPSKKSRAVALKKTGISTAPPKEEIITQVPAPTPVTPEEKVEEAVAEAPKKIAPEPEPEEQVAETAVQTPKAPEPEPQAEEKVEEVVVETPKEVEPEPQPEEKIEEAVVETPKEVEPEPQPEEKVEEVVAETPKEVEPEPQPEEKVEEVVVETPKEVEPEPQPEEKVEEVVVETPKEVEPEPQPEEKVEEVVVETPKEVEPKPQPEEKVEEVVVETPKEVEPEPQPEEKAEEVVAETPKEVEPDPQPEEKVEEVVAETQKEVEPKPQPEEKVEEKVVETPKEVEPEPQPEEKVEEKVVETPKEVEPEPQPEEKVEEKVAETPKAVEPEPQPEEELEEAVVVASKVEPKPQAEEKVVEAPKKVEPAPQPKEPAKETVAKTPNTVEPQPKPQAEEEVKESSENAITVSNEAKPEPSSAPGVVEETTEIVRQTTRARKTTKYLIGTVYDPLNSRPIPYATIHMLNSTCGVNIRITSDASGHYRLPLVASCCINIRVEKEGFQTYTALEALCTDKNGNIKGSTSILLKPEDPKPEPTVANNESNMLVNPEAFKGFERSKNKRLGDKSLAFILNVYYESARTSVKAESVEELKKLLRLLEENPTLIVEIGAHTDSRGSATYNQDLSQRRAENVVKYLVSQGINEKRLIPKGYGETQLINDCDDSKECEESEHQINRRTEFQIIGGLDKTK
ncbi:OmpA family protein [Flavilitoribacter nigricans]|uniref:OmpA-like domain-containing protein n=1 Tax=Flavilitoribacter nigricans (strain ATCC 23147 / DSM 23189 / NBRC 102662 / NCIMB 1420 / SS-2) TaxID=1122177 RepID=A0A2D0N066_FLAN2|nr:OmpA family protein [Flavilitoribacter nigricans]PHN01539.1 hypothetical protein CRP01_36685 [Flavilitoribacter nigricans DSM 23189 = NBRC 102662]